MDDTGKNLKQRRLHASLTQGELARLSGVAQSMISDVEASRRDITVGNLKKLLTALNIPVRDFFGDDSDAIDPATDMISEKYRSLPAEQRSVIVQLIDMLSRSLTPREEKPIVSGLYISGVSAAGRPLFIKAHDGDLVSLPKRYLDNSRFFAVKVSGDSMEPRIPDGSSVVVQKDAVPRDGEIALILLEGYEEGEYTIKQLYNRKEYLELVSLNKNYPPVHIQFDQFISAQKVVFIVPPEGR